MGWTISRSRSCRRRREVPAPGQASALPLAGATGVLGAEMLRRLAGSDRAVLALQTAPAGIHVAAPELVWHAAQGNLPALLADWLVR